MVLANIVALNSLKASLVMTGPHLRPCQHFICGACGIRSDCMVMLQTTFCCQFTNAAQSDVTASRFSVPSVFTTYIVVQNWDRSCALCSLWLILHFFFPLILGKWQEKGQSLNCLWYDGDFWASSALVRLRFEAPFPPSFFYFFFILLSFVRTMCFLQSLRLSYAGQLQFACYVKGAHLFVVAASCFVLVCFSVKKCMNWCTWPPLF